MAQVVQGAFQFKATELTIDDLGIVKRIEEARKTDKEPSHVAIYDQQEAVFKALKDIKVADFQQIIQWFGQTANAHAEKAASTVNLEDCFISLKTTSNETKETKADEGAIPSPYTGTKDSGAGGNATGKGSGDKQP